MDSVFGLCSEIEGIENEKQSKIAFFQELFSRKPVKLTFLKVFFFDKNVAEDHAQLSENMVSISVLGFEKFAFKV